MRILLPLVPALMLLPAITGLAVSAAGFHDHPQNLPRPSTPAAVVGDFNGDGREDLIVANVSVPATCPCQGAATLRVLLGNGTTTFTPGPEVPGSCDPRAMVAGDFDGDGLLDIATMDGNVDGACGVPQTLSFFKGDGLGGLEWLSSATALLPLEDMAVGDLDGNGLMDILGPTVIGGILRFRLNPMGTLFMQDSVYPLQPPWFTRIALGDVDGDGRLDAVTSNAWSGRFYFYRGFGAGFVLYETCTFGPLERTDGDMILVDTDGTGAPEIAITSGGPDGLSAGSIDLLQRSGSDPQCPWTRRTIEVPRENFTSVVAADFDGDGRTDLATVGDVPPGAPGEETTAIVRVFPNDGSGGFGPSTAYPVWESDHRLVAGDLNADGRVDLVATGRVNERTLAGHAHILFNGVPAPPIVQVTMATQPERVTWADAGADSYDVISGDLGQLGATGGRFDSATPVCLADDITSLQVEAGADSPPVGDGWFYLVRGNSPAGGTWDSGGRGQIGRRDPQVAASPLACP